MIRFFYVLILVSLLGGCSGDRGIKQTYLRLVEGESSQEQVAKAFDTDDPDRRREGIILLTERRGGLEGNFLKAYALLAEDPDPLVRGAAIGALGRAGDVEYLDIVINALSDKDLRVRLDAAEALDRLIGDAAVDPLTRLATSDPQPDIRARCFKALRNYKTRQVLNVLIRGLEDPAYGVRYQARRSLLEMTGEDCAYDVGRWRGTLAAKEDPFAVAAEDESFWSRLWR